MHYPELLAIIQNRWTLSQRTPKISWKKNLCHLSRREQGEERGQHLIDPILQEIKESTESDKASQELIKAIPNDFTNSSLHSSIKHFKKMKDRLSVEDRLILLDSYKIVIPQAKRREVLAKLHSSHQGIERIKRRAQQAVYWPGINSNIQNVVEACNACQKNLLSLQQEPLMSDPPLSQPFEDVSADLFCYAGKSHMVYIDCLSRWIKIPSSDKTHLSSKS